MSRTYRYSPILTGPVASPGRKPGLCAQAPASTTRNRLGPDDIWVLAVLCTRPTGPPSVRHCPGDREWRGRCLHQARVPSGGADRGGVRLIVLAGESSTSHDEPMTLTLRSPAFEPETPIPARFDHERGDLSPALTWDGPRRRAMARTTTCSGCSPWTRRSNCGGSPATRTSKRPRPGISSAKRGSPGRTSDSSATASAACRPFATDRSPASRLIEGGRPDMPAPTSGQGPGLGRQARRAGSAVKRSNRTTR